MVLIVKQPCHALAGLRHDLQSLASLFKRLPSGFLELHKAVGCLVAKAAKPSDMRFSVAFWIEAGVRFVHSQLSHERVI